MGDFGGVQGFKGTWRVLWVRVQGLRLWGFSGIRFGVYGFVEVLGLGFKVGSGGRALFERCKGSMGSIRGRGSGTGGSMSKPLTPKP